MPCCELGGVVAPSDVAQLQQCRRPLGIDGGAGAAVQGRAQTAAAAL